MNGPYFGPCTTIRQYRDRDQDMQNDADADTEAARQEADSFSFGLRREFTYTRLETEMRSTIVIEHDEDLDLSAIEIKGAAVIATNYGCDAKAKIDLIQRAFDGLPEDAEGAAIDAFEWQRDKYPG